MGITIQRQSIHGILLESANHLSADQIFEKARQAFPHIGKGTVYRNLNLMADQGTIRRVYVSGEPVRFDANTVRHQHMICVKCGKITDIGDVEPAVIASLTGRITAIVSYDLVVYAVCEDCGAGTKDRGQETGKTSV